ncbi:FtsK/SpoIIIE domain-containing protein [Crossiella sp. CA198]|uniref:FtsK/SpoIIIE domain-containing protein n=1 Tax=Crossiella sp. CA198 TaxID=3455607 RepID=UPI003F8D0B66
MGKTDQTKRTMGAEFKAALWLVRHPGILAAPTALGVACAEFGYTPTGLATAGVAAGVGAWYRAHPGSFDAYAAPVLRSLRQRWAGAFAGRRWHDLLDACGLVVQHRRTGELHYPRVLKVRALTPSVTSTYVRLPVGQAAVDYESKLVHLAAGLNAQRVALEQVSPRVVALVTQWTEPFTYLIPAPDMPRAAEDVDFTRLYVGEDEFGRDWYRRLDGTHTLTAGATGAGKNSLPAATLRALAPAIRDGLVRVWVCDPKQLEFSWIQPMIPPGCYATDPDSCAELIQSFVEDMEATQRRMQRARLRKVPISREYPLNYLIVDEIGTLLAYNPMRAREISGLLSRATSMGRATHHVVDAYVQEPSKDVVEVRELFPTRLCLRVTSSTHPDMVLGDGARARGAIADQIPAVAETAGIGFVVNERTRTPLRVRLAYSDDADLAELVQFVKPNPKLRAA